MLPLSNTGYHENMTGSEKVKFIRESTGAGLNEIGHYLRRFNGDELLAMGYMHYCGQAVWRSNREEHDLRAAQGFKDDFLANLNTNLPKTDPTSLI